MGKIIKKNEQRRRDEAQLSLYNQAHERLLSNKQIPELRSGSKEGLLSFVDKRIDEIMSRFI